MGEGVPRVEGLLPLQVREGPGLKRPINMKMSVGGVGFVLGNS